MFFKLRVKKKKNSSIYIPARSNILFCDYITLTVSGVYRISGGGVLNHYDCFIILNLA